MKMVRRSDKDSLYIFATITRGILYVAPIWGPHVCNCNYYKKDGTIDTLHIWERA